MGWPTLEVANGRIIAIRWRGKLIPLNIEHMLQRVYFRVLCSFLQFFAGIITCWYTRSVWAGAEWGEQKDDVNSCRLHQQGGRKRERATRGFSQRDWNQRQLLDKTGTVSLNHQQRRSGWQKMNRSRNSFLFLGAFKLTNIYRHVGRGAVKDMKHTSVLNNCADWMDPVWEKL